LAILGQKHFTGLEVHSWSNKQKKKQKILPLFVTQGQRENRVLRKTITKNKGKEQGSGFNKKSVHTCI
jgi:hypothetical protein